MFFKKTRASITQVIQLVHAYRDAEGCSPLFHSHQIPSQFCSVFRSKTLEISGNFKYFAKLGLESMPFAGERTLFARTACTAHTA